MSSDIPKPAYSNVTTVPGVDLNRVLMEQAKSPYGSGGPGDGGGTSMLEHRVSNLEKDMTELKVILARIDTKLDSKPGHWAVLGLNATLLGLVLAAIGFGARIL